MANAQNIELDELRPRPDYANDDDDEPQSATTALLHPQLSSTRQQKPQKLWPQIKDILIQSAPTLLLTTVGLLFTGELLDHVSRWEAMRKVDQLIMIIPVILNLKGNLEMNLSARLGTAANVGDLDIPKVRKAMILGNLSLLQVQAAVVSFVAASVSLIIGLIIPRTMTPPPNSKIPRRPRPALPPNGNRHTDFSTFIMVASTAMTATSLSSIILGSFMCGLIMVCRILSLDPDNIAPPVASCLGDLVTLILLGMVSSVLIHFLYNPVPFVVGILIILIALSCLVSTLKNPTVRPLLTEGWSPLFGAMIISSATGIVLDLFVSRYEGFALLAVVISGLPGSVGSVFVSRLSTALHAEAGGRLISVRGVLTPITPEAGPSEEANGDVESPNTPTPSQHTETYRQQPSQKVVMVTLLVVTLPVELIFLGMLRLLGWLHLPIVFVGFSIIFFCCAVTASLFIARWLTHFLWNKNLDPDMYALPIHSALMDLIGQILLVICFEIVSAMGVHLKVLKPG